MADSKPVGQAKPRKPQRMYVATLIGPYRCGKSTFARYVSQYFTMNTKKFWVDVFDTDGYTLEESFERLKMYLSYLSTHSYRYSKKLVVIIDTNLFDIIERFEVFKICVVLNLVYVQIFIEFDVNEVHERNVLHLRNGVMNYRDFITTNCLSQPSENYLDWESNSIVIYRKNFNRDVDVMRLYNFLLFCSAPRELEEMQECSNSQSSDSGIKSENGDYSSERTFQDGSRVAAASPEYMYPVQTEYYFVQVPIQYYFLQTVPVFFEDMLPIIPAFPSQSYTPTIPLSSSDPIIQSVLNSNMLFTMEFPIFIPENHLLRAIANYYMDPTWGSLQNRVITSLPLIVKSPAAKNNDEEFESKPLDDMVYIKINQQVKPRTPEVFDRENDMVFSPEFHYTFANQMAPIGFERKHYFIMESILNDPGDVLKVPELECNVEENPMVLRPHQVMRREEFGRNPRKFKTRTHPRSIPRFKQKARRYVPREEDGGWNNSHPPVGEWYTVQSRHNKRMEGVKYSNNFRGN